VIRLPRIVLNILVAPAIMGFVLGVVLHLLTYLGVDPRDSSPKIWYSFQLATAFLFIPVVIGAMRPAVSPAASSNKYFKTMVVCVGVFAAYALFVFIFTEFALNHGATPKIVNGQYVMFVFGVGSPITKTEYLKHRLYEAREYSAHWMAIWSGVGLWLHNRMIRETGPLQHSPRSERQSTDRKF